MVVRMNGGAKPTLGIETENKMVLRRAACNAKFVIPFCLFIQVLIKIIYFMMI